MAELLRKIRKNHVDKRKKTWYKYKVSCEGVWSSGMTEVSKTFSGGSIPSTPVNKVSECSKRSSDTLFFCLQQKHAELLHLSQQLYLSD